MRVLVTYGTKMGGTAGIAERIGAALTEAGLEADVRPASDVADASRYDAVLVGGALYMNRWHKDARRFVKREAAALRGRPVWLFSSGPLNDHPATTEIPPVPQVQRLMDLVEARGHATFGGRLPADAKGFFARRMAKTNAGDWRDPEHIHRWSLDVARALGARPEARPPEAGTRPSFFPDERPRPTA